MRVAYIQFHPTLNNPERNRSRLEQFLTAVTADLVVMPELANAGYNFSSMQEVFSTAEDAEKGATIAMWRDIARQKRMAVVGGFAERQGDTCYNSAALIDREGNVHIYRKLHLFGEESRWFSAGDEPPPVMTLAGAQVGVFICFDWAFPEMARILALKNAEIICHPSNVVTRFPPQAMVVRGVENRVFTITANRIGREEGAAGNLYFPGTSQVTTPDGEVPARAGETGEETAVVEIQLSRAHDKRLAGYTDLFASRVPEMYTDLADHTNS